MAFEKLVGLYVQSADIFTFNIKCLCLVGLWPKDEWNNWKQFLYQIYDGFLRILSLIFIILTGIGTYENIHNVTILLSNLDKTLVAYKFVLQVFIFVVKRKQLRILIEDIKISGDQITQKRERLMTLHVIAVTFLITALVGAFSVLAIINEEMPVEAWMPFNARKNRIRMLLATQVLAMVFAVPCACRATSMQGIVCSIIMYLCDQLIELQHKIKALKRYPENDRAMRMEFKSIIKKHVRLMRYSKSLEMIFKDFFLVQNLAVTLELCLSALMVLVGGLEDKKLLMSFMSFLCVALLNAYIYCYLGNELIVQSEGLAMAAYEAAWTSWPVEMQKELLILIRAAQKPLKLTAGGVATMSIQTFSQTLYNGYSIFAVINDFVN